MVPIILFTQYADLGKALSSNGLRVDRIVAKGDVRGLMTRRPIRTHLRPRRKDVQ